MAAAYCTKLLQQQQRSDWEALSAGICAFAGDTMSFQAQQVLTELGIDGSNFRSRRFTYQLAQECDLIFAMGSSHLAAMQQCAPECAAKMYKLLGDDDVPDPFGADVATYRATLAKMIPAIRQIVGKL
jgi:protein-tyrosine-phosphatase